MNALRRGGCAATPAASVVLDEFTAALRLGDAGMGEPVPPGLREDERVRYAGDAREAIGVIESLAEPPPG